MAICQIWIGTALMLWLSGNCSCEFSGFKYPVYTHTWIQTSVPGKTSCLVNSIFIYYERIPGSMDHWEIETLSSGKYNVFAIISKIPAARCWNKKFHGRRPPRLFSILEYGSNDCRCNKSLWSSQFLITGQYFIPKSFVNIILWINEKIEIRR